MYDAIAFDFPNTSSKVINKDLEDFVTSIRAIESLTDLDFFTELADEDENALEGTESEFEVWFPE